MQRSFVLLKSMICLKLIKCVLLPNLLLTNTFSSWIYAFLSLTFAKNCHECSVAFVNGFNILLCLLEITKYKKKKIHLRKW